jgi:transcriptional regulator with XRE-family HTH domain
MNLNERQFLRQQGGRIRQRREELGWTQADLGQRCGLHRTFIGSVERGERNVAILNLRTIASTLRVKLASLLTDAVEPGPSGR